MKPNILIIEENDIIKKRILDELHKGFRGFEYLVVNNFLVLTGTLEQRPWDIIILNNSVNKIDLLATIEEKKKYAPETPLIVISESDGYETSIEIIKSGAYDFVPVNELHKLNNVLEKALNHTYKNFQTKSFDISSMENGTDRETMDNDMQEEFIAKQKNETKYKSMFYPAGSDEALNNLKNEISKLQKENEELKQSCEYVTNNNRQLQQEAFLWRSVVESIADEVWISDINGNMSLLNVPDYTYLGLNKFNYLPVERLFQDIEVYETDGKMRPMEESPLIRSLKGETIMGEEIMLHKPTGISRFRQYSSAPTKDLEGQINGAVAIVRDITDVKRLEFALRDNEQRLRAIFDNVAIGIVEVDANDKFINVNSRMCQILGYEKEEFLCMTLHELTYPDDRAITKKKNTELHKGHYDIFNYEKRYVKRDGTPVWVHVTVSALHDSEGKYTGAIGTVENIEDRRKTESALQESNDRFSNVLNLFPEPFFIFDSQWRYVFVNNAALRELNRTEAEVIGKVIWDLFPSLVDSARYKRYMQAAKDKIPQFFVDFSDVFGKWYEFMMYPWKGGISLIMHEITDRKNAEDALMEANIRFDNVLNMLPDPFFIIDSDWTYLYVNNAAAKALRKSKDELIGCNVWNINEIVVGTERYNKLLQVAKDRIPQNFVDYSTFIQKWYEYMVFPWKDGITLLMRDVTDRVMVEQEQQRSEALIRDILVSIQDVFYTLDSDWRFKYVNTNALETWGKTGENLIGRNMLEVFPEMIDTLPYQYMIQVMNEKKPVHVEIISPIIDKWIESYIYPSSEGGITVLFRDISEKKKSEEMILKHKESLERAQATAHLGSWELDLLNYKLTWTDEVYRIFGIEPGEIEPTYEAFLDAIHPDDRDMVNNAFSESVETNREGYEIEHRIIRKNTGEIRFVHEKCTHIRDNNGKIVISAGMVHDITDRKRAELEKEAAIEQLTADRNLLETLVYNTPSAILLVKGQDYIIEIVNETYQMIAPGKSMSGKRFEEVWPEVFPLIKDIFDRVMETGIPYSVEDDRFMIRRSTDGPLEEAYFSWSLVRVNIPGENCWGILNTAIETTERKKMMAALKESEERFRLALDYSPVAVFTQDKELRYTWIYQSVFDIPNEEFIGKTDYDMFPLEVAEIFFTMKNQVIGQGISIHEKVSVTVNSVEYHLDISLEPLLNQKGEITGLACAAVNITDLVRLEEEKNKHEIEQLLERSARLASVGVIAGGITHEINQPLNAIRMGVDGTLFWNKRNNKVLPDIIVEMLSGVSEGVKKIDDIIKGMRFFWADLGKDKVEAVDFNAVIGKVLSFNTQKLANHSIVIDLELNPGTLIVMANELHLELVVTNILNNAIYALDRIQKEDKSISIRTYKDKYKSVIEIEDNGTGLPDVPEEKLFDPFFTTKPPSEGSGLGLAIAKMFLIKYNAIINAYNNETGGATFMLTFNH